MLFRPNLWLKGVLQIDEALLKENNIKGLILDLDNTLSMHGNPAAENGIFDWLSDMRRLGIKMMVVSNNTKERVAPLAKKLRLNYIAFGCKPFPFGLHIARKHMKLPRKQVAIVGDQIFTDVLAGNLGGYKTILVEPFHLETTVTFKIKRKLESLFFRRDYSKLERK